MKKITILAMLFAVLSVSAQTEVLQAAQKANDYFMAKYADPTLATNVGKIRPSSLWTRAVYYEGLMALNAIDPQQRYVDYATTWADFHQWTPRNGVKTTDADDHKEFALGAQTVGLRFQTAEFFTVEIFRKIDPS